MLESFGSCWILDMNNLELSLDHLELKLNYLELDKNHPKFELAYPTWRSVKSIGTLKKILKKLQINSKMASMVVNCARNLENFSEFMKKMSDLVIWNWNLSKCLWTLGITIENCGIVRNYWKNIESYLRRYFMQWSRIKQNAWKFWNRDWVTWNQTNQKQTCKLKL